MTKRGAGLNTKHLDSCTSLLQAIKLIRCIHMLMLVKKGYQYVDIDTGTEGEGEEMGGES